MLRDRRDLDSHLVCPSCSNKTLRKFPSNRTCTNCKNKIKLIYCKLCNIECWKCDYCEPRNLRHNRAEKSELPERKIKENFTDSSLLGVFIVLLIFLIFLILVYCKLQHANVEDDNIKIIKKLKEEFPLQTNETWYHVLSVLDKTVPSVKSIIFLHGEDKRTSDCLINKLVLLTSENKNLKSEEVTFSSDGYEGRDYGFALEHYRSVVEQFRILVTDLTGLSGNIARIFHSLCDEVSSNIKPSLFIFTLKYDNSMENEKPIKRVRAILQEAWGDLSQSEISPLLSRIVKNVVKIHPEKHIFC